MENCGEVLISDFGMRISERGGGRAWSAYGDGDFAPGHVFQIRAPPLSEIRNQHSEISYWLPILAHSTFPVLKVLATMKSAQIPEIVKKDEWLLATGVSGGRAVLIRFRQGFREASDLTGYPELLEITWTYKDEHASGMPNAEEASESQQFENFLCDFLECDFLAALTSVVITAGTIRWILYTGDVEECSKRIEAIPQKSEPYPINLATDTDPEWKYLREEVLAGCKDE
jgi:hypothetical protein